MASPIDRHKNGLAKLLQSEEFSDCKLICGPYHFNLHKVILASQSDYFKTAFKQGTFREGNSSVIELKTAPSDGEVSAECDDAYDEPEYVKLMVEYFYHFDYLRDAQSLPDLSISSPPAPQLPSQGYIIEHAKVFAIAVKYQIDGLRDLAASRFKNAAAAYWKHDDFAHCFYIAYESTPEEVTELREVVLDIAHQHFDDLQHEAKFETVFCNIPGLAYALLKRSRTEGKDGGTKIQEQNQSTAREKKHRECARCGNQICKVTGWDGKLHWRCKTCW